MFRLAVCFAACALFAACTNGSSSSNGQGGDGGAAGALASGGQGGDGGAAGGTAGAAGSAGREGTAGRGGSGGIGGAGGLGGGAASGGTGGASGIGGENTCPAIVGLTATPSIVPAGQTQSSIQLETREPDPGPDPLRTRLSATTGLFEDPEASATTYTCGAPGSAEITARVTDGDPECEVEQTIVVQCPNDIPVNLCPSLFTVNAIPSQIPQGQDSADVETRAADPDDGPLALVTTFYALYGTFDDPNAENTVYRCERSGLQEICVDASDGACVKTLCTDVTCPEQ